MSPYIDSGVLLKPYVREPNSAATARVVAAYPSITLNSFQELEIRNALRALEGRSLISPAQRAASERELEPDLALGRLRRSVPDWSRVFTTAVRLSADHTAATLARSLDILHVAIAITDQAELFVTGDRRQLTVARRSGLSATLVA